MNYVYLIQCGSHGPFKIGYTRNVFKRISGIQVDNWEEVNFVMAVAPMVGSAKQLERKIHKRLKAQRLRGEWFHQPAITYAKMLMREAGTPIKSLEHWEPGLYDDTRPGPARASIDVRI